MNTPSGHHAFFAWLVRRPVLLLTTLLTSVVIGVISYHRLPVQMMPDGIVEPGLQVYVVHPGSSAQENEEEVARVLEEEMRTLPGVQDIESESEADSVGIYVEFQADTDMNFAKAEVRDRIERARPRLPTTVRDIGIWSWSHADMPVMFVALTHPGNSTRTDFLVKNVIQRRLEVVEGVGRTEVWGIQQDSLRILLDEDRVRAAKLDLGVLIRRLSADNFALPLGEVDDGGRRLLLRSDMRFKSPEEIADYPAGDGLKVGDLGRVLAVKSAPESLFRFDGNFAYYLEIQKDAQANVVETCHRVVEELARLERDPQLAGGFGFIELFSQGKFIENALGQLEDVALTGGWLAILVLFLFLWRVRLTLLVALSIPISILMTLGWAYFTGRTFNVLTMTGITLALGMLVDNSIVVMENIVRLRAAGRSNTDAIVEGTSEVGLAVVLSTLTGVVVFLPLIFMSENPILRIMFAELGLPLCVALIASLVVALVFLPVLARWAIGDRSPRVERFAGIVSPIAEAPGRWLAGGLALAGPVATGGLRGVVAALVRVLAPLRWLLAAAAVAFAAWGASDRGLFRLQPLEAFGAIPGPLPAGPWFWISVLLFLPAAFVCVVLLVGLPRWRRKLAAPAESIAEAPVPAARIATSLNSLVIEGNHRLVEWSLQHRLAATLLSIALFLTIFYPALNTTVAPFMEEEGRERINFWVELEDNFTLEEAAHEMEVYERFLDARREEYGFDRLSDRFSPDGGRVSMYWESPLSEVRFAEIQRDIKENLPRLPGHELRFLGDREAGARDRAILTFRLHGPDSEELERLGEQGVAALKTVPGLSSVASPLQGAPRQVRVRLDSDLAERLDVTPRNALESISWALRGFQLPSYQEPGREIPLILEYDEEEVAGLATLRDLEVFGGRSAVPLSYLSDLEFGRTSRSIQRRNGQATFTIQARADNPARARDLSEAGNRALATIDLPRGYSIGEEDSLAIRQQEEFKELFKALLLSIVLVFLLMAILFESILLPLSVLCTIPFAILGSYWALYVTGTAMDSIGWIGIIILIGVEVNHGIVLIDRIHGLNLQGMKRTEAVLEGCRNRVRPILMTCIATVMGLWPLAVTEPSGEGFDYRALATCVAGGLIVSTVTTLWVVPLAYTLLDDVALWLKKLFRFGVEESEARSLEVEGA